MDETIAEDDGSDEPESHADRLFSMLRAWGLAEYGLDICLMSIMGRHETRDPLPPYPATLERKLDYLKEAVGLYPALAAGDRWMKLVVGLLGGEKKLRNDIVHGAPLQQMVNGTVHFMILERRKGGMPHYTLRTVRAADWDRLHDTSVQAFAYLTLLSRLIENTAPPGLSFYKGQKFGGKGGVGPSPFSGLPVSKALRKLLEELYPEIT